MASPEFWVVTKGEELIVPYAATRFTAISLGFTTLRRMPEDIAYKLIDLNGVVAGWSELKFGEWRVTPIYAKQGPYRDKTPSQ